ncbi:MAG TPA: AIR synthase [Clostridiales bacterium UBA8153]|nr:AIR synthase [Clostridiales bacterium UBA8153]
MKTGKLEPQGLERLVFTRTGAYRPEVVLGPRVGEDSAALDLEGELTVVTVDPITGADTGAGALAVHVTCNDLAATGAEPVAVLLTLLLPTTAGEALVEEIMESAHRAALQLGVALVGGHTEFTPGLTQTVVCAAAVGRAPRPRLLPSGGARPGDALVLVGEAGMEGTAILAHDFAGVLGARLGEVALREAQAYDGRVSVVRSALDAAASGATALHDVTEGGVLGASYEMALAAGAGLVVDTGAIPVGEVTRQIARLAAIDPFYLISSGALLIAAPDGEGMVASLRARGHAAAVIGRFTSGGMRLTCGTALGPPGADELWRARRQLERLSSS